jgi:hypothetical protein
LHQQHAAPVQAGGVHRVVAGAVAGDHQQFGQRASSSRGTWKGRGTLARGHARSRRRSRSAAHRLLRLASGMRHHLQHGPVAAVSRKAWCGHAKVADAEAPRDGLPVSLLGGG